MKYAKAIVPLALAGLYAIQAALVDGAVTGGEWRTIGGAVLTAVLVWLVPNKPDGDVAPQR